MLCRILPGSLGCLGPGQGQDVQKNRRGDVQDMAGPYVLPPTEAGTKKMSRGDFTKSGNGGRGGGGGGGGGEMKFSVFLQR